MSGPPYPPVDPSSNAIGSFIIGVSPIGTITPFDYFRTVISQYSNSPVLTQLIGDFYAYVDPTANLDAFFDLIWNVNTAQGYGLDVWGRIVNVSRVLQIPGTAVFFGFQEAGDATPFNVEAFYSGAPLTQNYTLADDAYRTLIFAKALSNISDGSIASINALLMKLFPNRGNAYVIDGARFGGAFGFEEATDAKTFGEESFYAGSAIERMTMAYAFQFLLSPLELAIVQSSNVLPKPTGVSAVVLQGV